VQQREWAERALDAYGERGLLPALLEVAKLRLANPDASLEELGRLCRPPITKPAVADRLRRLGRLTEQRAG
ncbi:MAG: helix-turn-helix domain-containing protein, partial [Actinomycetota bacterium]